MKAMQQTILVTGGTGKTGRRVAERLIARGVPVRIGSRSGERPFDWGAPEGWGPVLRDVHAAYLAYYPDLAVPGAAETIRSFAARALESGVRRLVLLSGRGEEEAMRSERFVQESGAEWTIVRASWFSQNFSENFFLDSVRAGEVVLPVGEVGEPFVDAEDIADVAAMALVDEGHAGKLYEVTGPRLLTFAEAVEEIVRMTGRRIRYVPVSLEAYTAELIEQGVPGDVVSLLAYLFGEVLDGRNASLTDGVERALGRKPRDFREYVRDTAFTGVWG